MVHANGNNAAAGKRSARARIAGISPGSTQGVGQRTPHQLSRQALGDVSEIELRACETRMWQWLVDQIDAT